MKTLIIIVLTSLTMAFTMNFKGVVDLVKKVLDKENALERPESIAAVSPNAFYDFTVTTLDGKKVSLSAYKGKKVVILNVASECGYTPQYGDWEKFYEANKSKFVVLGFPANNFGGQEPGSNKEIATFCTKNYGVTFPVFEKVSVKGKDKAPLYQWLTTKKMNGWNEKEPTWNFCKYLVNEKGELTNFFSSDIKPTSAEFLAAIK
jgi:glutathione peroxidase